MPSPMEGMNFLVMWIGFLLLMGCGVAGFFWWAIRHRQFSDQDRARYLALWSGIPNDPKPGGKLQREGGRQAP